MIAYHRNWVGTLLLCAAGIAGCGKSPDTKGVRQVAAKVNSDEITVHQVDDAFARRPNAVADIAGRHKREIVDKLIEQTLARQQAIERKLDRSPEVVQAIEAARSEILARAYLQQVAAAQPRPTPEEARKYYAQHPELFAQRRVYYLEEIALAPTKGLGSDLRQRAAKARSIADLAEWLESRQVEHVVNQGARPAEQIPLDLLPKLHAMREGEIQVMETTGGTLHVVRVVATKPEPIDETTATPMIQQFLLSRRSNEVIANEMKRLKEQARIEYVGEFVRAQK